MKRGIKTYLTVLLGAGIILGVGCAPAPENNGSGGGPVSVGNLIVTIYSPIANSLYNSNDPELIYTATSGLDNTPLATERLLARVHDVVDGEDSNTQEVENLYSGVSLPAVEDGNHKLEFGVLTEAGDPLYTTIIFYDTDITPPGIEIVAPTDGNPTTDSTPILEYTINEPCFETASCNEIVLVDGVETSARNGDPLPAMDDGEHSVEIIYTDAAGNTNSADASFEIDSTPPEVIFEQEEVDDDGDSESDDDTDSNSDDDGDSDPGPVTNPEPTIIAISDGITINSFSAILTFSVSESGDALILLDGQEVESLFVEEDEIQTILFSDLTVGDHTITIVVTDALGNQGSEVINFTVVDSTAPALTISTSVNAYSANLTFSSTESGTVTILLDGQETEARSVVAGMQQTVEFTGLAVGEHSFTLTASDPSGNESTPQLINFTILDVTAPIVDVEINVVSYTATLTFTVTEDGSASILLDGQEVDNSSVTADAVNTFQISGLAVGDHTFNIEVADNAGNGASREISFTVTDATPPTVIVVSPGGQYATGTVPLEISYSDDVTSSANLDVEVVLSVWDRSADGGGAWIEASTYVVDIPGGTLTVDEDGEYRVAVTVTDESQNVSPAAYSTFSVDTAPPVVEISSPADGQPVNTATPQLDILSNEGGAVEVFLFGGDYTEAFDEVASRVDVASGDALRLTNGSGLSEGVWTVVVDITDAVGNTGWNYSTFTVDAVGPSAALSSPAEGENYITSSVPLTITAAEFSSVTVTVDGAVAGEISAGDAGWANGAYSTSNLLTGLSEGSHTVSVVAVDANSTFHGPSAPVEVTFTHYAGLPSVTINSPAAGSYYRSGAAIDLDISAQSYTNVTVTLPDGSTTDLAGLPSSLSYWVPEGSDNREYVVSVVVTNPVGSDTATVSFVVDGTSPTAAIHSPEDGREYSTGDNVTLRYTSSEAVGSATVSLNGSTLDIGDGDSLGSLAEGYYDLSVIVTDRAGNTSPSASVSFSVILEVIDGNRRGKSECHVGPIKGDRDALLDLVECTSNANSRHNAG